ncbi:MAG: hypothetical protein ACSLFP_08870 [Acidimicrobiales bacterium]
MHLRRKLLVLLAAVLAPLTLVGVSAAMEGDPPADEAPVVEDDHGAAVSAAAQECPEGTEHGPCVSAVASSKAGDDEDDDADELDEVELDGVELDDEGAGPPEDTHGFAVSTAAKECPEGPEHGACVSEVAKSNAGQDDEDDEGGPRGRPDQPGERGNGGGNGQGGKPDGVGGPAGQRD